MLHFNDPEQQEEHQDDEQKHFVASFKKSAVPLLVLRVCPGDRDHKSYKKNDGENDLSSRKHGILF